MRRFVIPVLVLALSPLMPGHTAYAQARFRVGPQVGAVGSFSAYQNTFTRRPYQTRPLPGVEAGVAGTWAFGQRVVLQPALLFSQRGFRIDDDNNNAYSSTRTQVRLRLNYLSLPVTVAYALRADGQGVQVFGGAYAGVLLGGSCRFENQYSGYRQTSHTSAGTLPVAGSGPYSSSPNDPTYDQRGVVTSLRAYYSRRVDAGVQVGLGYRRGNGLVRAGYSLGLLNMGVGSKVDYGGTVGVSSIEPPVYLNQAVLLSVAYFFSPPSLPKAETRPQ